jgi:hypothetical protein
MLSAAMALLTVGWAGVAAAVEARGPICDDVNTVVVCDSGGSLSGFLDISNGTCGVWNMHGMLVGSFFWNVSSACGSNCASTQTCANYVWANGSNGYRFYQYHHNHSAHSYSRTCDRCALGLVGSTGFSYGAHVHVQHNQYSTKLTGWYSGYVTCGSKAGCSYTIGYPRMS